MISKPMSHSRYVMDFSREIDALENGRVSYSLHKLTIFTAHKAKTQFSDEIRSISPKCELS